MPLEITFLGAKEIGAFCLEHLLKRAPELGFRVVAARTRKGKNGAEISALAGKAHIPLLNSLDDLPETDLIISVQHHELLRQKDIDKARKIAVNLHLAPLPEYRGCNQFSYAILDEAPEFGVTLHQMDVRIDHGYVLFEKRFPVPQDCWVKDLYDLSVEAGKELFVKSLPDLISGNFTLLKQESRTGKQQSSQLHFRQEIEKLKEIPLDLPATEIEKRIRATMMPGFEPPYCRIGTKKVYFSEKYF